MEEGKLVWRWFDHDIVHKSNREYGTQTSHSSVKINKQVALIHCVYTV